jgi:hypothetical protein
MLGPILGGWQQYYGHFHGSALKSVWRRVNRSLIGWLMRKHKKLAPCQSASNFDARSASKIDPNGKGLEGSARRGEAGLGCAAGASAAR